jgi:hypothetical protein
MAQFEIRNKQTRQRTAEVVKKVLVAFKLVARETHGKEHPHKPKVPAKMARHKREVQLTTKSLNAWV